MSNTALMAWRRLSPQPGGRWLFSRIVCLKAPYFGSIRPTFVDLQPGRCELRIRNRRSVRNHLGTVNAIAMCCMAELAAGTMIDATLPPTHRWIPRGMTVEYLKKAATDLRAVAEFESELRFGETAAEIPVIVHVMNAQDEVVFRAKIRMWVSPRRASA
jgi:acyl-coenzyme A thioesterase PaaI-like protein